MAKEHSVHLECRLKLWEKGDIVMEGHTIQCQLEKRATTANKVEAEGQVARTFTKLMLEGKEKAELSILAQDSNDGVNSPNEQ